MCSSDLPKLVAILTEAAGRLSAGEAAGPVLEAAGRSILAAGFREVEYVELRSEADLSALERAGRPARLLVAAWLGQTRLIDNVVVQPAAG